MPYELREADIRTINQLGAKMRPRNQNLFELCVECQHDHGHTHDLWIEIGWDRRWYAWRDGKTLLPDGQHVTHLRHRQGTFASFQAAVDAALRCQVDETLAQRCCCADKTLFKHGDVACPVHPLCPVCELAKGQWPGYGRELEQCTCVGITMVSLTEEKAARCHRDEQAGRRVHR